MDFDGKTAFIAGGAAGIGFAITTVVARNGAAIAIADVDSAAASAACERLAAQGLTAIAVKCDVADPASTVAAAATTAELLGEIDLLINNAGLHLPHYTKPVLELGSEKWRRLLDVNVLGIVHCAEACRPFMRARGAGLRRFRTRDARIPGGKTRKLRSQRPAGQTVGANGRCRQRRSVPVQRRSFVHHCGNPVSVRRRLATHLGGKVPVR